MYKQLNKLINNTNKEKYAIFNVATDSFIKTNLTKLEASKYKNNLSGMQQGHATILKY
jgi:hypothetical protein